MNEQGQNWDMSFLNPRVERERSINEGFQVSMTYATDLATKNLKQDKRPIAPDGMRT